MLPGHHYVDVGLGVAVQRVVEVERGNALHDAHGHRRHLPHHRRINDAPFVQQLFDRQTQGYEAASHRRRACAAVGLQHVAVDVDGALAQPRQVAGGAQRAADQSPDLHAASVLLYTVARLALGRGTGQHGVFGGQPAAPRVPQKRRHALLYGGRA